MKIVLSYNEIAEHARRQYNLPPDAVVVISRKKKPAPVATLTPVHSITKTGHAVPHFLRDQRNLLGQPVFDAITEHLALNKIAAIKEVRAAAGFGLKEAKDCVENWYEFHKFMLNNNRWPRLSYPFGSVDFN